MFWKRKPVTHAALLWLLVGFGAGALVAILAYASMVSRLRTGVVEARPPRDASVRQQQPPTLFGTVVSFDGTILKVDSKQPFDEVIVESDTKLTTVGGSSVSAARLTPGAVVTATGVDVGDGRLSAVAIVILQDR